MFDVCCAVHLDVIWCDIVHYETTEALHHCVNRHRYNNLINVTTCEVMKITETSATIANRNEIVPVILACANAYQLARMIDTS